MNFRTYLALEASLGRRLIRDWREHSMDLLRGIEQAVADGHYHKARDLVAHIDLSEVGEKNRDYIEYMLRSFAVFGAKMANRRNLKSLAMHDHPVEVATTQMLLMLEHSLTSNLQDQMLQSIALAEEQAHTKVLESTQKGAPIGNQNAAGRRSFAPVGGSSSREGLDALVAGVEKAHALLSPEYREWATNLTEKEDGIVEAYKGDDYKEINNILRDKPVEDALVENPQDFIATLDSAIEKAGPVKETFYAYRGVGGRASRKVIEGAMLTDKAYTSVGLDIKTAGLFTGSEEHNVKNVMMRIKVSEGTSGAYLSARATGIAGASEGEFLLPRGSSFKVGKSSVVQISENKTLGTKVFARIFEVEVIQGAVKGEVVNLSSSSRFVWEDGDFYDELESTQKGGPGSGVYERERHTTLPSPEITGSVGKPMTFVYQVGEGKDHEREATVAISAGGEVSQIYVPEGVRGKGVGMAIYRDIGERLLKEGVNLKSGLINHPAPTKIWDALVRAGQAEVIRNGYQYVGMVAKEKDQKEDIYLVDLNTAGRLDPQMVGIRKKRKAKKIGVHSLYVHRKLKNTEAFAHWAKQQGFTSTLLPEDLHTTIIFSKTAVEWGDLPHEHWVETVVASGGPRSVEALGDKGAVVLRFECPELVARWQEGLDIGASWDYDGYKPHVTITYDCPPGMDLGKVVPFTGALEFGPEVYEPVDTDKEKMEKADRILPDFTSFGEAGDRMLMLASSLQSSRLSTYGFVAEAEQLGEPRYQLSAVLDGRTSKFCRMIDGREFDVKSARGYIEEILSTQDPEALREIQAWPDQSDAAIEEYAGMSEDQLVEEGLNIPPFHPWCRTLAVSIGDGEKKPSLEAPDVEDPAVERGQSSGDDFAAVGQGVTEEQLQEWNDYIDTLPNKVLASMFGMTEAQILAAQLEAGALTFAADGTLEFAGEFMLAGRTINVGSILDPYTGRAYIDNLLVEGGTVEGASEFVGGLLRSVSDQASSVGMTEVVVKTGGSAYQYAQMGFLPQADDWQFMRIKWIDEIENGKLTKTFARLDDDQQALVLNLLSNENEGALGVLVDLPISVGGRTLAEILLEGVDADFSLDLTNPLALARAQQYI